MVKKTKRGVAKRDVSVPEVTWYAGITQALSKYVASHIQYFIFGALALMVGIVISWKAQLGACILNCNTTTTTTDNSRHYYIRESKEVEKYKETLDKELLD